MNISMTANVCEGNGMNPPNATAMESAVAAGGRSSVLPIAGRFAAGFRPGRFKAELGTAWLTLTVMAMVFTAGAEVTNSPASTNGAANLSSSRAESTPQKLDETGFRIISERNIFNANRSGGTVRIASSRRPVVIDTFKLVGTMAYEKGVFAFFEGSSSEFTKVVKADGVIAGHKLVDILTDAVKLEADGKIVDVPVGSAMRREDNGAWRLGEAVISSASPSYASNRESRRDEGDSNRSGRSGRNERDNDSSRSRQGTDSVRSNGTESSRSATTSTASTVDQSEILKRLMERREKEAQ